jgi:TBC1 domain family member 10
MQTENKSFDKYGFIQSLPSPTSSNLLQENARLEKWTKMLANWSVYNESKASKLKSRIRKGIPNCLRGRLWYLLADADTIKDNFPTNYYSHLLSLETQRNVETEIGGDLNRTYPHNKKFIENEGKEQLFRVLKAYAIMDPEVGYTQGMSFIAAMFLMFMNEEDAFWMLVTLLTQYEFREFYVQGMPKVYKCLYVANGLLQNKCGKVFRKLKENGVSVLTYATQWFITGFTSSFTIETVLRVWDCFFYEGPKVFYRVYLAVMMLSEKELGCSSFESAMEYFRTVGKRFGTNAVIDKAFKVYLSRKLISKLEGEYGVKPNAKYVDWITLR